jgi:hypothetical protein
MLVRCNGLSFMACIVWCDELYLTADLNNFFLNIWLPCLRSIMLGADCSLIIFIHELVEDESHK